MNRHITPLTTAIRSAVFRHSATFVRIFGRPRPRPHCARWGHGSPPQKGGTAPNFRSMFVVAKRLYGSRCHLVRR